MRTVIAVFSGTGNTRRIAEAFGAALGALGEETSLVSLDNLPAGDVLPEHFAAVIQSADRLGIAYPVHAFNASANLLQFAKRLPSPGKPVFLLNTSGEPLRLNGMSSRKLRKILRHKGYPVQSEYHYCMPYNIIFRHGDAMAWRMLDTALRLIPLDAAELVQGIPRLPDRVPLGGIIAWLARIEHWGARWNGRLYRVSDACVRCNQCVRQCPAGNIAVDASGKLQFGGHCLMCMRCSLHCPKDAIRIGLFNGWKVNGPYRFQKPAGDPEPQRYNRLLTRAYDRYFRETEQRLAAAEQERRGN